MTIAAGSTTAIIDVNPVNDAEREEEETVEITLQEPSGGCGCGGGLPAYEVSGGAATVSIADNDDWQVTIEAIDAVAAERALGSAAAPIPPRCARMRQSAPRCWPSRRPTRRETTSATA